MDAHSVLSSLIAAGVTQAPSLDPVKPPQTGFNPVIKAFAFALRTFTTLDDDLAASGQVFLIGGPRQYGLPTSLQDEKYLNDAMFNTCDPIQSSLTPVYSQGGPSYFEWLRGYIHNVEDLPKGDKEKLQSANEEFQAASQKVDEKFRDGLKTFEAVASAEPNLTLAQWMDGPSGRAYRDACHDRDQKEAALKEARGSVTSEVARAQGAFDLARSRQEYKPGYNMPCASRDIHTDHDSALDTIFKPSYYLSGYATASEQWIMQGDDLRDQIMVFSPVSWIDQPWSRLGHSALHNEGSADLAPWMRDVQIVVKFRGILAFDVHRGFWDIPGLDHTLPPLKTTAAPVFISPILKTTKLLVGYGVRVQIHFPPEISKVLQQSLPSHFTLLPQLLAGLAPTWNNDGSLEAALPAGNAYPVLLGALAHRINVNNSRQDNINPPIPPASVDLGSGSFNTMDVREIYEPSKDTVMREAFPKAYGHPPSLAVGLNRLDISKNTNIRVKAFPGKITTSAGNIHISTWADTVLYSAGCSWLRMQANDSEFQTGQFSTLDDHEWNKTQMETAHRITFPRPYATPPTVIVWLNELDMSRDSNWRVAVTATDITITGFIIHLDTWADTVLYSAAATWIAYSTDKPGVTSGKYSTEDMRPWNMPQQRNWGWANFPYGTFKNAPTVVTGISSLDVDCRANLRLALDTHSVSEHGMNWAINGWADTVLYSTGGSYIAFS